MNEILAKYGISYDAPTHHYERFGVRLDSVTSVLPYLVQAPPEVVARAGERGKLVAECVEQIELAAVPVSPTRRSTWPLPEPLAELVNKSSDLSNLCGAYIKFRNDFQFVVLRTDSWAGAEVPVYHKIQDYVGRLDLIGTYRGSKGLTVIDVKTSAVVPVTVGVQVAAYKEAWNSMAGDFDLPKAKSRAVLHLRRDGSYYLGVLNDGLDWPRFCSILTTTRWARELGHELTWTPKTQPAPETKDSILSPEEAFL